MIQAQKEMVNSLIGNIHTSAPGKVISYSNGRAVVQSLIKFRIDEETMADSPPIAEVPIIFPSGSGGNASVTFPIKAGDGVLLCFSERAIDDFLQGGQSADPRQFDLTDAMAIPGLYPSAMGGASKFPDDVCLYHGGTSLRVQQGGNVIVTGGDLIVDGISFKNHVHGGVVPGGGNTAKPVGG